MPDRKRILIVEDDQDVLLVLRDRLESYGHQITTVTNGRDAVNEITKTQYAMVIMDIMMSEMDGIEALRLIRGMKQVIPVIMITANKEKAIESLALGAQAYILKPIDQEKLKAEVEYWLSIT
jgi:CheY-like chemotaxis protein